MSTHDFSLLTFSILQSWRTQWCSLALWATRWLSRWFSLWSASHHQHHFRSYITIFTFLQALLTEETCFLERHIILRSPMLHHLLCSKFFPNQESPLIKQVLFPANMHLPSQGHVAALATFWGLQLFKVWPGVPWELTIQIVRTILLRFPSRHFCSREHF